MNQLRMSLGTNIFKELNISTVEYFCDGSLEKKQMGAGIVRVRNGKREEHHFSSYTFLEMDHAELFCIIKTLELELTYENQNNNMLIIIYNDHVSLLEQLQLPPNKRTLHWEKRLKLIDILIDELKTKEKYVSFRLLERKNKRHFPIFRRAHNLSRNHLRALPSCIDSFIYRHYISDTISPSLVILEKISKKEWGCFYEEKLIYKGQFSQIVFELFENWFSIQNKDKMLINEEPYRILRSLLKKECKSKNTKLQYIKKMFKSNMVSSYDLLKDK